MSKPKLSYAELAKASAGTKPAAATKQAAPKTDATVGKSDPVVMPKPHHKKSANSITFGSTDNSSVILPPKPISASAGSTNPSNGKPSSVRSVNFGSFSKTIDEILPAPMQSFEPATSVNPVLSSRAPKARPPMANGHQAHYSKKSDGSYNAQQQSVRQPPSQAYQQQQPFFHNYYPAFRPNYQNEHQHNLQPFNHQMGPQQSYGIPMVGSNIPQQPNGYPSALYAHSGTNVPVISKPSPSKAIKIVNPATKMEIALPATPTKASAIAPSSQSQTLKSAADLKAGPESIVGSNKSLKAGNLAKSAAAAAESESPVVKPESVERPPSSGLVFRDPLSHAIISLKKPVTIKVPAPAAAVSAKPNDTIPNIRKQVAPDPKIASSKSESKPISVAPISPKGVENMSQKPKPRAAIGLELIKKQLLQDQKNMDNNLHRKLNRSDNALNSKVETPVAVAIPAAAAIPAPSIPKIDASPKPKVEVQTKVPQIQSPKRSATKQEQKHKESDSPAHTNASEKVEVHSPKKSIASTESTIQMLKSTLNIKYPKDIANPNIKEPFKYTPEFLLAMRKFATIKPAGMLSVSESISNDSASSPRVEKSNSFDRGRGSMQRQSSNRFDDRPNIKSGNFRSSLMIGFDNKSGPVMNRSASQQSSKRGGRDREPSNRDRESNNRDRETSNRDREQSNRGGDWGDDRNRRNRGLSPPPEPAFEPLTKSENAWKPKKFAKPIIDKDADEGEARVLEVSRLLISTLNKLAPERFDKLSNQILNCGISDERILVAVIDKIYDKALTEAHYGALYARLCKFLSDQLPHVQNWITQDAKNNAFRRLLLNKCQKEFEKSNNWAAEEAEAREKAKVGAENMTKEELEQFLDDGEKRIKIKIRSLGNVHFVGELFKLTMLSEKIMHRCVGSMLENVIDPEEEVVESLCKLLKTIGARLDHPAAVLHMNAYFERIKQLSDNLKLPSRIRFMLLDLIDARKHRWVDKNAAAGPKTLAEIRRAPEKKEMPAQRSGSYRGSSDRYDGGSRRDAAPAMRDQSRSDRDSDRGSYRNVQKTGRSSQDSRVQNIQQDGGWSTVSRSASANTAIEASGSSEEKWKAQKPDRNLSSRGTTARISTPPVAKTTVVPTETKKANMFELLEDKPEANIQRESSQTSLEADGSSFSKAKILTDEEKEAKIPSFVREWFSLFNNNEIDLSLAEIGPEYHTKFISLLLVLSLEEKKEAIHKTIALLKRLRAGAISMDDIKTSIALFVEKALDEELFSELPQASYVLGSLLGDLLIDECLSLSEVSEMISGLNNGRIPDSAKTFAITLNNLKNFFGDTDTISFLGDFDLRSLWKEEPEEDVYASWIAKNSLEFLSEISDADGDDGDATITVSGISDILASSLGQVDTNELIAQILTLDVSIRESDEFILQLTSGLISYMTSEAFKDRESIEPSRETYLKYEELMDGVGALLLSTFIDGAIDRKLLVLTSCKEFAKSRGYPKSLLDNLFRLLYKSDVIEGTVYLEWNDCLTASDANVKKELNGWFESLLPTL